MHGLTYESLLSFCKSWSWHVWCISCCLDVQCVVCRSLTRPQLAVPRNRTVSTGRPANCQTTTTWGSWGTSQISISDHPSSSVITHLSTQLDHAVPSVPSSYCALCTKLTAHYFRLCGVAWLRYRHGLSDQRYDDHAIKKTSMSQAVLRIERLL